MKETKIAMKNIEIWNLAMKEHKTNSNFCDEHKETCKRDVPKLKKLKHLLDCCTSKKAYQDYLNEARELVDKELEDKEQTIKIYEDNGL